MQMKNDVGVEMRRAVQFPSLNFDAVYKKKPVPMEAEFFSFIILPVLLFGWQKWFTTLGKERKLAVAQ